MNKEFFKIENCYNYVAISEDREIIEELKEDLKDPATTIFWNNFESGDIYYNANCEEYKVKISKHMQIVILEKL